MKSAKLYQFPQQGQTASTSAPIDPSEDSFKGSPKTKRVVKWKRIVPWTIGLIWLFLGMCWPLLNWIAAMDVVFQFLRALYYSNTPAIHATLQAALHGVLYILLSLFVYLYRPKLF
ncbi:MAG: KleE stable inheritance protein [Methylococcales bacterium]|nr:KleE stable inheritance protein [Methylococcales bacterium]